MPFKTILIHAGKEQRLKSQLAIGAAIATRFQSHLIGLAIVPPAMMFTLGGSSNANSVRIDAHRTSFLSEAGRMHRAFERAGAGQNFTAEWIVEDADRAGATAAALTHTSAADLVVASAEDRRELRTASAYTSAGWAIASGRPFVVAPKFVPDAPVGQRILVAWNGSREASKAAFDALPMMKTADYVKVLLINADRHTAIGEGQSGKRLCEAFARHGVRARLESISLPEVNVGSALRAAIKAENADLLVMGCYGYLRQYELKLGCVSRNILHDMPVPVLMSH